MVVMPQDVEKIDPPRPTSIEDDLMKHSFENAFLDLRHLDGWGRERYSAPTLARPFGYGWMKARWNGVFDGLIFNRKMRVSSAVPSASAPAAPGTTK